MKRIHYVIAAAALLMFSLLICALLLAFPPGSEGSIWPGCVFQRITGLYCVSCGGTRALYELMHGNILRSASMNALLLPSIILIAAAAAKPEILKSRTLILSAVLTAFVFFILRNIPAYPFTLLAPV